MGEQGSEVETVVAVPIRKFGSDGIIAWRFSCSCGREGKEWHSTPEAAIAAGRYHRCRSREGTDV